MRGTPHSGLFEHTLIRRVAENRRLSLAVERGDGVHVHVDDDGGKPGILQNLVNGTADRSIADHDGESFAVVGGLHGTGSC